MNTNIQKRPVFTRKRGKTYHQADILPEPFRLLIIQILQNPVDVQVDNGLAPFGGERVAGTDEGLQQGEGSDGLLYKGGVRNSGDLLLCLLNPFQASASGINHGWC